MAGNASYNLLEIILTEAHFTRVDVIVSETTHTINYNIETAHNTIEDKLFVTLGIEVSSISENKEVIYQINVKMAGVFVFNRKAGLPLEKFAEINAPAIIFPFVREQIASISLKSGINPTILLPTINFIKMAEDKKT